MGRKEKEIPGTYDSVELLYTECAQKGIEMALENAWKGSDEYKERNGSFGLLVKYDKENTAAQNEKKSGRAINDITCDAKTYADLDIQACNKIIQFLVVPREKILKFHKLDGNKWDKCVENCKTMNSLRNKYYHKTPKISPEQRRKGLMELVQLMEQTIGMVYSNVKNEDGVPYLTLFKQERMLYEAEQLKQKYFLSDYLDLSKYDVSKFFTACAELGIKDPGKEDGRLYFHSADLDRDLKLLKNYMTLHDEGKAEPAEPATEAKTQPGEAALKKWTKYLVPAAIVLALLVFGGVFSALGKIGSMFDNDTPSQEDLMDDAQSMLENMMGGGQEETADPNKKNQIPEAYENDVKVLQSADDLKLNTLTLEVEVGKTVAPHAAGTWKNGVIYSQDTDIAKPDGQVVLGVAPGETYIVYAKGGMSQAYRVVVSEPEATADPNSTNQIPPKYNQDIQLLQLSNAQRLDLMTLRVAVGEFTAPREASTFRAGVIYSQNTDVVLPDGLIIKGIAPGETYIIYDNDGLVTAYRVIVEG